MYSSLAYEVNETDQKNSISRTNQRQDFFFIYFDSRRHDPLRTAYPRKYIQSVTEYDKLLLVGSQT